ncbi:thioredoxin-like protein Clot [Silene latifolia]|uniref:thioredoxin-like protein Clot n=1 Tax=Silene latifolia TaxID=37657 RepID=UPI003D784E52
MGLTKFDATISNFDEIFPKFEAESPNHKFNLILFLADIDPSTSLSWCPDCVRAEPIIYRHLEESNDDVALLRAYVGDKPTWRNPQHPWRIDPRFEVKGVPTLVRWGSNGVEARLEDDEAHVPEKIAELLGDSN